MATDPSDTSENDETPITLQTPTTVITHESEIERLEEADIEFTVRERSQNDGRVTVTIHPTTETNISRPQHSQRRVDHNCPVPGCHHGKE